MKESTIMSLQALGSALDKTSLIAFDLPDELDEQVTLKVRELEQLFKQNAILSKLYDEARLDTLDEYHASHESRFFVKREAVLEQVKKNQDKAKDTIS